jgi:CRP-like cAMP-binding protein
VTIHLCAGAKIGKSIMQKGYPIPIEELIKLPLFQNLGKNEVLEIISGAHEKHIHAGSYFYLQGDPAESMYVLIHGRVKRIQAGQDGKQVLIQVIKPIHPFGLSAMSTAHTYPVTAEAAEDSTALYWAGRELMNYAMNVPQMAINAIQIMAEQLHEMQDRFRQVTTQRVEQRLAHTLFRLAAKSGKKVKDGILIDMTFSRQDLAEMSGTTLYTASRTISQWEDQKLVIAGRQRIIICNPHGLARVIEGVYNSQLVSLI